MNTEAQELLLRSALQVGHDVDYWLERVSDSERRVAVLAEAACSKLAVVRHRAAKALGTQDVQSAVEHILGMSVREINVYVRDVA